MQFLVFHNWYILTNGCYCFDLFFRDNFLVLDIFFEALNYETIEQKKAYDVAGLLGGSFISYHTLFLPVVTVPCVLQQMLMPTKTFSFAMNIFEATQMCTVTV